MTNEFYLYGQANTGFLRNSDGAVYSNTGATVGFGASSSMGKKSALFTNIEAGIGTAITANAKIGYKRALNKNSNLVFSGNFSYDKSLTRSDNYNVRIDNNAMVNGKKYQLDLIDKNYNWKPDNLQYSGKVGYNKETKWGGYEVGAEVGYRTNSSPDFYTASGSKSSFDLGENKTYDISTHYEYGRDRKEGVFATPYGNIHANLTTNGALQAIGKADIHEVKVGLRYNF